MKLKELFEMMGWGVDRGNERDWRDQMVTQHQNRNNTQSAAGTSINKGFWIVSREGKTLAGPFTDQQKANQYKAGRPDRIPANAVIKSM